MSQSSHGTMRSYVIGFISSLLLTGEAYYLVVNKSVSGTGLLVMILGLAVLQMFVQIFFFLHLGRGPKPLYNVTFFGGTVGIILVVVLGSIFIMNNLHYNMAPPDVTKKLAQDEGISQVEGAKTGACQEVKTNHEVTISKGRATPLVSNGHPCDELTFVNNDTVPHDIVFGSTFKPESYGGESHINVPKSYTKTITLNQLGTYTFHDKLDPGITGSFTVAQ